MASAAKKSPAAVDIVFGMGPKKPMPDDDHAEAKDMLVGALNDAGIDGDKADALVDALHEYVMSCVGGSGTDEEEPPESGKEY
jgi:hypothetical protein